jgi:hypothetical protein
MRDVIALDEAIKVRAIRAKAQNRFRARFS